MQCFYFIWAVGRRWPLLNVTHTTMLLNNKRQLKMVAVTKIVGKQKVLANLIFSRSSHNDILDII